MPAMRAGRLLVVSDEPDRAVALEEGLTAAGHRVVTEERAAAACARLREHAFDVVVTDLQSPAADALAILRAAKRSLPPARSVMVLDTAPGPTSNIVRTLRAGATACVERGGTVGEVISTALTILGQTELAPADRTRSGRRATSTDAGVSRLATPLASASLERPWLAVTQATEAIAHAMAVQDVAEAYRACAWVALHATAASAVWITVPEARGSGTTEARRQPRTGPAVAPRALVAEATLAREPLVRLEPADAARAAWTFVTVPLPRDHTVGDASRDLEREAASGITAALEPGGMGSAEAIEVLQPIATLVWIARHMSALHERFEAAIGSGVGPGNDPETAQPFAPVGSGPAASGEGWKASA